MSSDVDAREGPTRIGVVIPAYNAARFLTDTLQAALDQTYPHWICVVVDDGSTDATLEIAQAFATADGRVRALSQVNSGPIIARNRGFAEIEADIDYVTFMDADDVWRPDALATLLTAIDANPDVIGAHGLADFIDELGRPYQPGAFAAAGRRRLGCRGGRPRPWPLERATTFENIVMQSVLFPPGLILARADAYREIGLFDQRHLEADDWEVLMRLTRLGDLAFVNEVILGYRRHDSNLGAGAGRAKGCADARRATFYAAENTPDQQAILRDAWRAAQIVDARERLATGTRALRRRSFRSGLVTLSRLPLVAGRYVRGRPRPLRASRST